jgi:hypothetical protein
MYLVHWRFWWPWQCASTALRASTHASCSALQSKPLESAIGWIFTPYCPGNRQGPIQTSKNTQSKQMHLTRWPFRWPRQCTGTVPRALTNAPCSALQLKPLDTAIGQVFAPYQTGNRQGPIQTSKRTQSKNKTNTQTYIHSTSQKSLEHKFGSTWWQLVGFSTKRRCYECLLYN